MIRYVIVAALALAGCVSTPEGQTALAKTCETGTTMYGYIKAAAVVEGAVPASLEANADKAWSILQPLCEKGAAATDADVVFAGAQVYVLIKTWRDAKK